MTEANKTLQAARAYVARGLGVFPLIGKQPVTEHGVKDASTDDAQIVEWFPRARNIAIAIPPGVVVVDVDPRNGGEDSFREWLDTYGADYWTTAMARTGGGGQHYWFRYDGRRLKKNPAAGIDLLTHGRYVVAPPSQTTEMYRWQLPLPNHPADELPELPGWLYVLATPEERIDLGSPIRGATSTDPLNEAAHRMASWAGLLARHGWKYVGGGSNEYGDDGTKWRHPASDNPFSATIKHDCLFVYSPNTPFPVTEQGDPHGVTLYRAIETLDYGGDRKACVRALRDAGYLPTDSYGDVDGLVVANAIREVDTPGDEPEFRIGAPLDWPTVFTKDQDVEDRWLSEPVVARKKTHALFAGAKTGKSLFFLELAAALAAGRPFLDKPAHDPIPVMYCDYEMTDDDVRERLETFGYGPADLALLYYFLLGSGNGLDTPAGGADLVHDAVAAQVELVVIDTTARAVVGAENEADTLRAFYRCTGSPLKRANIAMVRLDHAGKDVTKGQRGTSAKNDDVDVVWRLSMTDGAGGYLLESTHQRMGWVPHKVPLAFVEAGERTNWERRGTRSFSDDAMEVGRILDAAKVPYPCARERARAALKDNGREGASSRLLNEAAAYRKYLRDESQLDALAAP